MSTAGEALAVAILVAAAVAVVAWPLLSPERGDPEQALSPPDRERLRLLERRARVDEDRHSARLLADQVGVREVTRIHASRDEHPR